MKDTTKLARYIIQQMEKEREGILEIGTSVFSKEFIKGYESAIRDVKIIFKEYKPQ